MTDARNTQTRVMVGSQGDGPPRATQVRLMVGVKIATIARLTQARVMVGIKVPPPARLTQARLMVGVKLERPACDTQDADFWRIERTDGTVFRFTSHDRRITFGGEVYTPCGALSASALQLSSELGATDNVDLSGIITAAGVTEADLWAGLYDGAEVRVYRGPWNDPASIRLVVVGNCGSLTFTDNSYKFEIVTAGERLSQRPILSQVLPTCRFKTYDGRCGLVEADFTETGSVTGVVSQNVFTMAKRRVFSDSTRVEADDYFTLGKLTWLTGANAGLSVDVKDFGSAQFILEQPMPRDIEVGDTYSVTVGDDQTFETCRDKFANFLNFGGFHKVKGPDDLNKTPDLQV